MNHTRELVERGEVDRADPPLLLRLRHSITSRQAHGGTIWSMTPKEAAVDHLIYYLHGGSYVNGFTLTHWLFLSRLVDELECSITAPDYPLPPAHQVGDVFRMVVPLYRELADNLCGRS